MDVSPSHRIGSTSNQLSNDDSNELTPSHTNSTEPNPTVSTSYSSKSATSLTDNNNATTTMSSNTTSSNMDVSPSHRIRSTSNQLSNDDSNELTPSHISSTSPNSTTSAVTSSEFPLNSNKLTYSAKKRLAKKKKKQAQLSNPTPSPAISSAPNIPKVQYATNLARRSLPHLNTFDEYHIDRCHLPYVRLDNSRSPTWSIKGNFYRNSKDPYDRIIIN
jgi:hypothetical protein